MKRQHPSARALLAVLFCIVAPALTGCADTVRQRYDHATIAVGGLADATRIAVSSGYVKDPTALATLRFGLLSASNAVTKAKPYVLAGQKLDATYWLDEAEAALVTGRAAIPGATDAHRSNPPSPATRP